MFAVGNWWY